MRRALGTDGTRLFRVSEYLTTQQCASYFSRLASKVRHQMLVDFDVKASEEETNFSRPREAVNSIVLQHSITYDHYDICAMVHEGPLKQLKLGMLQNICEQLELDVPPTEGRFAVKRSMLTFSIKQLPAAYVLVVIMHRRKSCLSVTKSNHVAVISKPVLPCLLSMIVQSSCY